MVAAPHPHEATKDVGLNVSAAEPDRLVEVGDREIKDSGLRALAATIAIGNGLLLDGVSGPRDHVAAGRELLFGAGRSTASLERIRAGATCGTPHEGSGKHQCIE
ncbi:MAG TPA: hypothetical protein PK264_07730 [Hyphomicrobiaceae bacterium]|nr:hypothetical protein [Hyphomicrobiaceae bacterium]